MNIDPNVFDPIAIDRATRAANTVAECLTAEQPPPWELGAVRLRELRASGGGVFGDVTRLETVRQLPIEGPGGPVSLRIFMPESINGLYVYFHGGGWTTGGNDLQDPRLQAVAEAADVAVVSVGYRLAPEHPYPAAADDAEAATVWILENALDEFGTDRLLIGGSSAGAQVAVVTLLRMRDRHGYTGFLGANLIYGFFDLSLTPSVRNWGDTPLVLNTPILEWLADNYVQDADPRDPDISPLYADVASLCPALFTVGTMDPLLDDTLFMAARWQAARNETEVNVVPGGMHGFIASPIPPARAAVDRMHAWLEHKLT